MTGVKRKPTVMGVGRRLTEIRKQQGLSQRALAKLVGTSGRMIAYYEGKTAHPPTHLIEPLCRALKVSADELLGLKYFKHDIADDELKIWKRFKKIKNLSVRDQKTIYSLAHALLSKKEVKELKLLSKNNHA